MPIFIKDLIDAKEAYKELEEKGLMYDATDRCKKDLFTALDLTEWGEPMPHTAVLYDDAINIFKTSK
jgi:hypothetical protein